MFHVAVAIPAIPPLGFDTEPALKNFSEIHVLSSAKDPVPHVITEARGNLYPLLAASIFELPNPLTVSYTHLTLPTKA